MAFLPPVAIVGPSGSGKSRSIKNLNRERTLVLNIERKILPFKEALLFGKNDKHLKDVMDFEAELELLKKRDDIDTVVIESATKYFEVLLMKSKLINKGYEIYNFYNDKISKFLENLKALENKYIFLLAIDERVEFINPAGALTTSRRIKVAGKQWEGCIEKEFAIVLFTDVSAAPGKPSEYRFLTNNDGTSSAKSPEGMFELKIPNDLAMVKTKIGEYYGIKEVQFQPVA